VFEVPEQEAEKVAAFVEKKMDSVVELSVPIRTSVKWGPNWGSAKD
jgi:DNA polymerase I-like protein with 3'-5' exonuclease and polymerase domains